MVAQEYDVTSEATALNGGGMMRRRGLIAGAAALAAGVLATRMSDATVDAADGTAILQGAASDASNTSATTTTLTVITGTAGVPPTIPPGAPGGLRIRQAGVAIPDTTFDAIQGLATGASNSGGHGRNDSLNGIGTTGVATNGTGVYGQSGSGSGIGGFSTSANGVYGKTTGVGLVAGLYGTSDTAYGIIGNTTAPFYSGLTATTATPNCAAFAATSTIASAFAAYFTGFTYVQGSFAVSGSKSAAVMHPDGTRRLFYCVESPDAWFEDFGAAKLVGGKADVKFDSEFALFVETADYHVFLTEQDTHQHLIVTKRTATGFSVEADPAIAAWKGIKTADLSGSFSWRLVAKRKDNPGKRLEKLHVPKFNTPSAAEIDRLHQSTAGQPDPLPRHKG